MSLETLASAAAMQGHFDRAVARSQDMLEVANKGGNRLWEAWALNSLSEATHVRGDDEATVKRCKQVLNILAEESDKTEVIRAIGIQAAALLRLDTPREALEAASETASHIASRELTSFATFEGFAGVCEVMLTLAKGKYARGRVMKTSLGKDAKKACRAMRKYARIFPIGRPRWLVAKARMLALRGRHTAAVNALERAVVDAEYSCMPYEQGLALLELGRCTWLPEKKREEAFVRALGLLPKGFARRQAKQLLKGLGR